jgi:hypothetical protein
MTLLAAGASACLLGCSSTTRTVTSVPVDSPPVSNADAAADLTQVVQGARPRKNTCEKKGIDPDRLRQGTCIADGQKFVVVNRGGTIKLHALEATVLGTRFARQLDPKLGRLQFDQLYYVVRLRVKNKLRVPMGFDWQNRQATLLTGGEGAHDDISSTYVRGVSFPLSDRSIRPGRERVASVVFVVKNTLRLTERNRARGPELQIVDPNEIAKRYPSLAGQIRLFTSS